MSSKIKNIIIIVVVAAILILAYVLFFNKPTETANLMPASESAFPIENQPTENNGGIGADFLSLLLNVKSIKLNDTVFTDPAFSSLRDSSIDLVPDQTAGRPNPFAPIGTDILPTTQIKTEAPTTDGSGISGVIGTTGQTETESITEKGAKNSSVPKTP